MKRYYTLQLGTCLNARPFDRQQANEKSFQITYQVQRSISECNDGILGEHDRLASVPWHGELCEDDAGHAGLDYHAQDALQGHHNDGEWTLLCCRPGRE